jgi:hypothetical protein
MSDAVLIEELEEMTTALRDDKITIPQLNIFYSDAIVRSLHRSQATPSRRIRADEP